jgi:hypothetical protein
MRSSVKQRGWSRLVNTLLHAADEKNVFVGQRCRYNVSPITLFQRPADDMRRLFPTVNELCHYSQVGARYSDYVTSIVFVSVKYSLVHGSHEKNLMVLCVSAKQEDFQSTWIIPQRR